MEVFEAVRIILTFGLAFLLALILEPFAFRIIGKFKKVNIRDEKSAPIFHSLHKNKSDTPTMGGVIIWSAVIILAILFWLMDAVFGGFGTYFNFISRPETYLPLFALLAAAGVGLVDDLFGIWRRGPNGGGLSVKQKLIIYLGLALVGAWWFFFRLGWTELYVPLVGTFDIGAWYIPFFVFTIVASAFSANETDGLDGLLSGTMFFGFAALGVVAFVTHRYDLAAMTAAMLGALLAFLWFNLHPAKFFMGDTGSMSLGITLGVMAMLTNTALFLPLFAFIPMMETITVIIQLTSKKLRGKKIFLSTPIHHHFEAIGWPETRVTMRFWIINGVTSALGLALYLLARFA